jgi:hypothetical protein
VPTGVEGVAGLAVGVNGRAGVDMASGHNRRSVVASEDAGALLYISYRAIVWMSTKTHLLRLGPEIPSDQNCSSATCRYLNVSRTAIA